MDEKLMKIMSDGAKLPLTVYRAFAEMVDFYQEGVYTVKTVTRPSTTPHCHYVYTTEIVEHTDTGDRVKAIKSLSD